MAGAFRWHSGARLSGPDGAAVEPGGPARATGPDRPATEALRGAMAAAAASLPFRIGGEGEAPPAGDAPAFETLTGGTTGTPRRIRRTHASWAESFAVDAGLFGIGPGVPVAVPGRLVHSLPLYGAIGALHLGARLHLLDGLRPAAQRAALAARQVAVLWATPAQIALIAAARGPLLPDLRCVLVGGGTMPVALRGTLAAIAPQARIVAFYGSAETSFIAVADEATPAGAVGRAYPGVDVTLRDEGAIHVRSAYLAAGYAGASPGSAQWRDGGVLLADRGRWRDGHLILAGRADRMVRIADQPVWPDAVEAFLLTLPGVTGACVIARPDRARGAVLDAVLTGIPAAGPVVATALRAAFGPMVAPRRILWRDAMPLTPAGKIDRAALAAS